MKKKGYIRYLYKKKKDIYVIFIKKKGYIRYLYKKKRIYTLSL